MWFITNHPCVNQRRKAKVPGRFQQHRSAWYGVLLLARSKQRWAESKVTCSRWIALTSHIGMHLLANMLLKLVELREGNFLSIYDAIDRYINRCCSLCSFYLCFSCLGLAHGSQPRDSESRGYLDPVACGVVLAGKPFRPKPGSSVGWVTIPAGE